jgi:hypothetical protein
MTPMTHSLDLLEEVTKKLEPLLEELVFVGGSVLPLYQERPELEAVRHTDAVDCIIEAFTTGQFHNFEARLIKMGLSPCQEEGPPLCRWWVSGIKVDFMPVDPKARGFSNRWYRHGFKRAVSRILPSGREIKVLALQDFLATKMEAHADRGGGDPRLSQDLEDVFLLLDSQLSLEELSGGLSPEIEAYLEAAFHAFLKNPLAEEAVSAALEYQKPAPLRKAQLLGFIRSLALKVSS